MHVTVQCAFGTLSNWTSGNCHVCPPKLPESLPLNSLMNSWNSGSREGRKEGRKESALCYLKWYKITVYLYSGSILSRGTHQQQDMQALAVPLLRYSLLIGLRARTRLHRDSDLCGVVDRWLTWMLHVYSVSSSCLTVQLYSRSRFLMLPLMNRLNIFSENRCSASRTRTITSNTSVLVNVTLTTIPGPLNYQQPCGFSRRGAHHCCPVKLSCSGPVLTAESKDARIQIQRQLSPAVCLWWSGGLSLTIHRCHLSKRAGPKENWRQSEPTGACGVYPAMCLHTQL